MSKPITPAEIGLGKGAVFPAIVFDAFNAEIAARSVGGTATVRQAAIVERLIGAGFKRHEVFDNGWLNIEDAYREAGWNVTYSKPGFNEEGEALFEFRSKA